MTDLIKISSNEIQIRFVGNGLMPNNISTNELCVLLKSLEEGILPILEDTEPEISFDNLFIGLKSVEARSISFSYIINNHVKPVLLACNLFISSMVSGNIDALPLKSQNVVKRISVFNNRHSSHMEFNFKNRYTKKFEVLQTFGSIEKVQDIYFEENKTYFGKLIKIDMREKHSRVSLRLINGESLNTTIPNNKVKIYREFIGESVKIKGVNKFSGTTLKRKAFRMNSMVRHDLQSVGETIDILRSIIN